MSFRSLFRAFALSLLLFPYATFAEKNEPITYAVSGEDLNKRQAEVERHLSEVYSFWLDPAREDKEFGGFQYYLDEFLQPAGPTRKNIMMHLRMLYNYAVGAGAGEGKRFPGLEGRLERQLDYLEERFRDGKDNLWHYELERDGTPVPRDQKLMIAQVYVIYLLSEVHLMTGNKRALRLASETFARIESAHDPRNGGYRQLLDPKSLELENLRKSCATNLHMLLALSRLAKADDNPLYRERLMEIYELLPRYVEPASGNAYWALTADWQAIPFGEGINNRTMYGHNAEMIWYMTEAAPVAGRETSELVPFLRRMARGLLDYGISPDGAVYFFGPINGASDDRQVQWWAPVETMIAFVRLYRLTGDADYWATYCRIADWTFSHFVPKSTPGAWYTVAQPGGEISDKSRGGFIWKSGFHEIRGLTILQKELMEIARVKHASSPK